MNKTRNEMATIRLRLRLLLRESSSANGKTKCRKMSNVPKYCQPWYRRMMYQRISESMLPDQMISHCENERYAQSTTKANISLPKSCRKSTLKMRDTGSISERRVNSQMVKQKVVSTWPTMNSMPQTVDHHSGYRDM